MAPDRDGAPPSDAPSGRSLERTACTAWNNGDCAGTASCPPRCPRFFDREGSPLVVRPPRDGDWERLLGMYEAVETTSMGLPPVTDGKRRAWLDRLREAGWSLLAFAGDRVVGHICVTPADEPDPEFVVFVHDAYHDRGIGTELVTQAVAHAADDDYDALTLHVEPENRRAIAVYSNVGFETVDDDRELRMRLPLDDPVADRARFPPADRPAEH